MIVEPRTLACSPLLARAPAPETTAASSASLHPIKNPTVRSGSSSGNTASTCRRDPDQLLHIGFLLHQVSERNTREQLVHSLLEREPDRPDAAGVARITSVGIHRVRGTIDLERLVLRRRHDVANRDVGRLFGQVVAAAGSTHALHQPRTPEPKQNLLD